MVNGSWTPLTSGGNCSRRATLNYYLPFTIYHLLSALAENSVPERRAAGNLFEGVGEFAVGLGLARLDDGDDARVLVPHHARNLFERRRARGDRHVARHDVAAAKVRARSAASGPARTHALVMPLNFKVALFGTAARVVFVA